MQSSDEPTRFKGRARMENVILLESGQSMLLDVVGVDAVYVVGFPCDVRGFRTAQQYVRIPREQIALRIQVGDEERIELARALRFDQQAREFEAAF